MKTIILFLIFGLSSEIIGDPTKAYRCPRGPMKVLKVNMMKMPSRYPAHVTEVLQEVTHELMIWNFTLQTIRRYDHSRKGWIELKCPMQFDLTYDKTRHEFKSRLKCDLVHVAKNNNNHRTDHCFGETCDFSTYFPCIVWMDKAHFILKRTTPDMNGCFSILQNEDVIPLCGNGIVEGDESVMCECNRPKRGCDPKTCQWFGKKRIPTISTTTVMSRFTSRPPIHQIPKTEEPSSTEATPFTTHPPIFRPPIIQPPNLESTIPQSPKTDEKTLFEPPRVYNLILIPLLIILTGLVQFFAIHARAMSGEFDF